MKNITIDYTNIMNPTDNSRFLNDHDFESIRKDIETIQKQIQSERETNEALHFLSLPNAYDKRYSKTVFGNVLIDAKSQIDSRTKQIRNNFSDYVQIAIGGSALGSIALVDALGEGPVNVHLPDNIDPEWIASILDKIDPQRTILNIISKSGGTVETLSTFFIFYEELKKKVDKNTLKERITIMTNPERGPLYMLAKAEGFQLIPIPNSVHGRFSVLSPGGLLTAAVAGINIDELLDGARKMDEITTHSDFWKNPVLIYAAIHYLLNTRKSIDTLVLMPYSNSIKAIADWYSQLVAESLGKKGMGVTPVKAVGATDQHSQLQLYNDGPKNKFITFFSVEKFRSHFQIPEAFPSTQDFQYLSGHSINELFHSEERATAYSVYKNMVPNCTIKIPEVSAYYMGQLFMFLEKVIPVLGNLYNVNAFDQPGVEESKEYARALLGKEGEAYEKKRREIEAYSDPANRKIV